MKMKKWIKIYLKLKYKIIFYMNKILNKNKSLKKKKILNKNKTYNKKKI